MARAAVLILSRLRDSSSIRRTHGEYEPDPASPTRRTAITHQLVGHSPGAARDGRSSDARAAAALRFARRVAEAHGRVSDADLAALRDADYDEGAVIEIVVTVALNALTNYVNNVAQTDIDFPKVTARIAA